MTVRNCSATILLLGAVCCAQAQPTVEKNVTGITLTITFEPSLALDQLEVSCVAGGETVFAAEPIPEEPRELSAAGEVLAILFDDERADTAVDLTVDGYASGVHVVSESTQVTLLLGQMTNARVNLAAECGAATDCTSPGPCELADDPKCEAGECVCDGPDCGLSIKASRAATSWGYEKVYHFYEGYPAWKSAGYPVE